MAYTERTGMAAATQSILTDDPDFLRALVERVNLGEGCMHKRVGLLTAHGYVGQERRHVCPSPFKGEAGRGMGLKMLQLRTPSPPQPSP